MIIQHAVLSLTLASTIATAVHAHGGQYTQPPFQGPAGPQPTPPKDNTGFGPPPTPVTSGPGPAAPRVPSPGTGGRGAPTTGGPPSFGASRWDYWWRLNGAGYLQLKQRVFRAPPCTGSDDFVMGRGLKSGARDVLAPSAKDIANVVRPALRKALEDPASNRDIISSCMVALARIGRDPTILTSFKKFLPSRDQEVRETAALAMGITARPEAVPDLIALASNDQAGRTLVGRPNGVDFRTRAFACYGLGLIAYASADAALKTRVFETMKPLLDEGRAGRRDVAVAALHAIRLLRPDLSSWAGNRLHAEATAYLLAYLDRKGVWAQVRAHAITALATLCGRANDPLVRVKARLLAIVTTPRLRHWIHQSAILALGRMASAEDRAICDAVQRYMLQGRDLQARYFCAIALGQIGGEGNRAFLRKRLNSSRTQSIEKPWLALGLAIMDADQRHRDASREVDSTAHDVRRAFLASKNPTVTAGLAVALGIMRDKDAGDMILERMLARRHDDEPAGYMAIALGLMGYQAAKDDIHEFVTTAERRPKLMTRCSIALGLLGDKELSLELIDRLRRANTVAVSGSLAQALGFIGDRRSLRGLADLLGDKKLQPLSRAFAAVALGLIADKEELPWNSKISANINYRASTETLTRGGAGILDIL